LIQEENEAASLDNEISDAKARKKQQLIDAEKDYQKNILEEEADDKVKAEKEAEEMEERMKEDKHNKAAAEHTKLLAEAMNESLVQVYDNVESNSPMDIIGSGIPMSSEFLQIRSPINEEREGIDRNSAADIIGSGPVINNELLMLRSPNYEMVGIEANSAVDMIGSGPEWNPDSFVQVAPIYTS